MQSFTRRRFSQSAASSRGRALRAALALALLLRMAIPAGYMPGNVLAGEFMVLCPEGLPAAVLQSLHKGHGHHDTPTLDADSACPIGTALQAAAPPSAAPLPLPQAIPPRLAVSHGTVAERITTRRYDSRAPPRSTGLVTS